MAQKKNSTRRKSTKPAARGKKTGTRKSKKTSLLGRVFKWILVLGIWASIGVAGLIAWYAQELPDITKQASFEYKTAITVKAVDGTVIARYGEIKGENLSREDLPKNLIYAVLATEDRRFYSHFGIDLIGLSRAMYVNARAGRLVQGGSTITQQLAKNLFLSRERTIKRKIQEAMLALWLEHTLTKDEILSAYLNRVYLGSGTYGVDAAARLYFEKPVSEITLREAAMLAGLLKAPSRYSPLNNPGLAKQRADTVLSAMVDAGYITEAEAHSVTKLPPHPNRKPTGAAAVRYYTDWVVDGLEDLIGTPEEDIIVYTTLVPDVQERAEESLTAVIRENGEEKKITQGAALVMRPDGAVLAMVGGRDYGISQFNRAVQARRQPGSSFKPIVYLTALEHGWRPDDMLLDEPITEGKYRPENFGGKYYGEVTLTEALTLSLNTISYQLIKAVGPDAVIETARRLGIYSPLDRDLSLGLGSSGISMLEMGTAYSTLANGGMAVYPYAITKITSKDGELYYQRPAAKSTRRVINPYQVDALTGMMRSVIENGTGQGANPGFPAAGKTGTSQDSRDAWFAGFTNEIVSIVWLGNDDNSPMKAVTGGSFPAQIWRQIMTGTRGRYAPINPSDFADSARFNAFLNRLLSGPSAQQQQEVIYWNQERRYNE